MTGVPSLAHCFQHCDAQRAGSHQRGMVARVGNLDYKRMESDRCMIIQYAKAQQECTLMRSCGGRSAVQFGVCQRGGPCTYMHASAREPPHKWGNYTELRVAGTCGGNPLLRIGRTRNTTLHGASLAECVRRCDRMHAKHRAATKWFLRSRRCDFVEYDPVNKSCTFRGPCHDRVGLEVGMCYKPGLRPCFITSGPTSANAIRAARMKQFRTSAAQHARDELNALRNARSAQGNLCSAPRLANSSGHLLGLTRSKNWRYYSVFECGNSTHAQLCLMFKAVPIPSATRAYLGALISTDGANFHSLRRVLHQSQLPIGWNENTFLHNLAILPLGGGEYAMVGGQQGFVSEEGCRELQCRAAGSKEEFRRAYSYITGRCTVFKKKKSDWYKANGIDNKTIQDCIDNGFRRADGKDLLLECNEKRSRDDCLELDHRSQFSSAAPAARGILLSQGHGLPWGSDRWSTPNESQPIITGDFPLNCVDRRPQYTGYPRLHACEFDGRLSLVKDVGFFRLYARANLKFQAIAGGRFVQTTTAENLTGPWQRWEPVSLAGVNQDEVDVYFFAVQRNPVDERSLVAIFPLTHPPMACIMIAFSHDGISFSRPINLLTGRFGWRSSKRDGSGGLEWRSEDHPAAGLVRAPNDSKKVQFFVHHAVRGTTTRKGAIPHVRVYQLGAQDLLRYTQTSLLELAYEKAISHRRTIV